MQDSPSASYVGSDAATLGTGNGVPKCKGSVRYRTTTDSTTSLSCRPQINGIIDATVRVSTGRLALPARKDHRPSSSSQHWLFSDRNVSSAN